jgi:hypothetical protein
VSDFFTRQVLATVAPELQTLEQQFTDAVVVSVEGRYATVDLGAGLRSGVMVPHGLDVLSGDHVWMYRRKGYAAIVDVRNRNAVIVENYPRFVLSGNASTPVRATAGVSSATVDIATGLSYVPLVIVLYESASGVWRQAPDYALNASGQVLDAFRYSVRRVGDTTETRLTLETQTTRGAGIAAINYRWNITDRRVQ